ncbi:MULTISPECIES: UrcA family protein [Asticcacaulis]|uniref:UrcA family protein n=1 Tax=Asticcacaulis TaxID=76890 RepID=UPI001AE75795|nr:MULTISPECIES: UrcA family protein [Asticcacaulis]MBP2161675.1 UrcA family protein [Asticcacaulis solisilvae]MDR6802700.1 UrcA family protein [Asticcacaulis sp. BE141]
MFRTVAALIVCTAAIAASPTLAESNWLAAEGKSETLKSQDVDFNKPSEVRAFYKKLRYAAVRVCMNDQSEHICQAEALSDAVRQVNQPQLSMHHEKATGERGTQLAWNEASR